MKKTFFLLMIFGLCMAPTLSHAQDSTKAKKKMEIRKAFKERWQNATPEEKEKMKEKAKALKAKYDSLPPEKKAELKEKIQARKDEQKKP